MGGVSPGDSARAPFWLFQTLILEEASELLTSNVRQQAMLCVVALRSLLPVPRPGPGSDARTFGVGGRATSGRGSRGGGAPSRPPSHGGKPVGAPPGEEAVGRRLEAHGPGFPSPGTAPRGLAQRPLHSVLFPAQPGEPALRPVPEAGPGDRGRRPRVRPAPRQAQRGRDGQRQPLCPGGPVALAAGDPVGGFTPGLPSPSDPAVSPGRGPRPSPSPVPQAPVSPAAWPSPS